VRMVGVVGSVVGGVVGSVVVVFEAVALMR
jgi:hypothetical protein